MTTQHVLERAGSRIHYWLSGIEGRPLVTFSHGATMDHRMFDRQIPAVAAEYRTLTWDARGHGLSKPIGGAFTMAAAADDLLALIQAAGYEQAALVGQSMGGFIAQELILKHPDAALAFVSIGSTPVTMPYAAWEIIVLKLTPALLRLYPYSTLKRIIARNTAITPDGQAYALDALNMIGQREFQTIMGAVGNALHEVPGYRIPCPLLLTHGERDDTGRVKVYTKQWAARDTGGEFAVIPDAGHNANDDNPAFFNRLLLDFLHEHVPPD